MPAITSRATVPSIYRNFATKLGIESMLERPISIPSAKRAVVVRDSSERLPTVGNCFACLLEPNRRNRKTRKSCSLCNRPICNAHTVTTSNCFGCK